MYGFPLDHLQRLVVSLCHDVFAIYICMKLFKDKTYREAFSLYVCIHGLNISECLASKGYGPLILKEGSS